MHLHKHQDNHVHGSHNIYVILQNFVSSPHNLVRPSGKSHVSVSQQKTTLRLTDVNSDLFRFSTNAKYAALLSCTSLQASLLAYLKHTMRVGSPTPALLLLSGTWMYMNNE